MIETHLRKCSLAAIASLGMFALPACGPREEAAPARVPTAKSEVGPGLPSTYTLTGDVREIDRESGRVVIRHDAIPGFMPAMTMPFDLAGQEVLGEIQVGDRIEGDLIVGPEGSRLADVFITELAEPPADGEAPTRPRMLQPGELVPDFLMTTQEGEPQRLSDLRGSAVYLTFIYTRCPLPDFCPLIDRKFAALARRLDLLAVPPERVKLLSVSFDPEHDRPAVLARHAALLGAKPPRWTFAVADHEELAKVAGPLGLTYGDTGSEIVHTLSTALIDAGGRLVRIETGRDWDPDRLAKSAEAAADPRPPTPESGPGPDAR